MKPFKTLVSLFTVVMLSACGGGGESGDSGDSGSSGTPDPIAKNILVANARNVGISAVCVNGGIEVDLGVDTNGNGTLDQTEITSTKSICHGSDGADGVNGNSALIHLTNLLNHQQCDASAVQIDVGVDLNEDNELSAEEITATSILCANESSQPTQQLSGKGSIKGQVPVNLLTIKNKTNITSRTNGGGLNRYEVTSQSGSLWLTPDDVIAALLAEESALEQAALETTDTEIDAPVAEAIEVEVDADGRFEVEVPAGTDYELVFTNGDATEGAQVGDISVSPNDEVIVEIDESNIEATGSVSLEVQSAITGAAIENARVRLFNGGFDLVTNETGGALLEGLAPGQYRVIVEADGYVGKNIGFSVASSMQSELGVVALNSQKGRAVGKVEALGLESFGNIVVYARSADGSIFTTLTDQNGHYGFNGLPVGEGYSFIAHANDFQANKQDNVVINLAETSSVDLIQLSPVVTKNDVKTGSITGYAKFGEYRDKQNLHAGIIVSVEGTDKEGITSRDGAFIINGLVPGQYVLNYTDSNHKTITQNNIQVVSAAANHLEPQFLEGLTGAVSGQVLGHDNNPVSGALVSEQTSGVTSITDDNGVFVLTNVIAGSRFISVAKDGSETIYVSVSIEEDKQTDISEPIQLLAHTLSGSVYLVDGLEHSGVSVLVLGSDLPPTITDVDGDFTIYGLANGNYKLLLTKSGYQPKTIDIEKNTQQFQMSDTTYLEGNAGSLFGTIDIPETFGSVQGVRLELLDTNGNIVAETQVDASGVFLLTNIEPENGYSLKLSGMDEHGNLIETSLILNIEVAVGATTALEQTMAIQLIDPNPPIIHNINFDNDITTDSADSLLINPTVYSYDSVGNKILETESIINFEVVASDADDDVISYSFDISDGDILSQSGHLLRWRAPENGGPVQLVVTAMSKTRTTQKVVNIKVNHHPEIRLTSHSDNQMMDDENILTITSIDLLTLSAIITDVEDGDLTGEQVQWISNIQGVIGTGNSTTVSLSPGKHKINIVAEDMQGLAKSSPDYYINVNTPEQILLKVAGQSVDYYGKPLSNDVTLDIQTNELTLNYTSSNTDVAVVSDDGKLSGVMSGTCLVRVTSEELDEDGQPRYETSLVVRVVGEADPSVSTYLSPNQVFQIRVNKDTEFETFLIPNLKKGHYSIVLFDQINIVAGSNLYSKVTFGGAAVTDSGYGVNRIHNFEVVADGSDYEFSLWVGSDDRDLVVKAALYPGTDVRDDNGYINESYWDKKYEPNDSGFLASPMQLANRLSVSLGTDDSYDYYQLNTIEGQTYTIEFANENTSLGTLNLHVGNRVDEDMYLNTTFSIGTSYVYEFTAVETGVALFRITPQSYTGLNKYFKYTLAVYPAAYDGLIQRPDSFEFNNSPTTAYPVSVGMDIDSELTAGLYDRFDYYRLPVNKGEQYIIEYINHASSSATLNLSIGTLDNLTAYDTLSSNKGTSTYYEFEATSNDDVYLKLARAASNQVTKYFKYTLKIRQPEQNSLVQDAATYEFNNTPLTAYAVPLASTVQTQLDGNLFDRFDNFSFNLVKGETYTLQAVNSDNSYSTLNVAMGNTNDQKSYFSTSVNKGTARVVEFEATTNDAIMNLAAYSSTNIYEYFNYDFVLYPSVANGYVHHSGSYEFNDSKSTAYPIAVEQVIDSELLAGNRDTIDYYSFEGVSGQTYTIQMVNHANSISTLAIKVGNNSSESAYLSLSMNKGTGNAWQFTPTEDGTVYIKLNSYSSSASSVVGYFQYQLQILPSTDAGLVQDLESFEYNNTAATAYSILLDQTINSELKAGLYDPYDFYSLDVEAGVPLVLDINNFDSSATSLGIRITNEDGGSYYNSNIRSGAEAAIEFVPTSSGTITIQLYGYGSSGLYQYFGYEFVLTTSAE